MRNTRAHLIRQTQCTVPHQAEHDELRLKIRWHALHFVFSLPSPRFGHLLVSMPCTCLYFACFLQVEMPYGLLAWQGHRAIHIRLSCRNAAAHLLQQHSTHKFLPFWFGYLRLVLQTGDKDSPLFSASCSAPIAAHPVSKQNGQMFFNFKVVLSRSFFPQVGVFPQKDCFMHFHAWCIRRLLCEIK